MSFQFRFESLLQVRRRERDEAGAACGQASEAISRIDQQLLETDQLRMSLRKEGHASLTGNIQVDNLLSKGRYDMQLEAEINSLRETHAQLTAELARRHATLVAAESEVKKLERLQENEQAEYEIESRRREQLESDDAATRRYLLQRHNKVQ
ncbi:MAG: flagellar export protein FliJ [Planctomycetota bacterium]